MFSESGNQEFLGRLLKQYLSSGSAQLMIMRGLTQFVLIILLILSVAAATPPPIGEAECVPAPGIPCGLQEPQGISQGVAEPAPPTSGQPCAYAVTDCAAACAHLPWEAENEDPRHICIMNCIEASDARRTSFLECVRQNLGNEAYTRANKELETAFEECPQFFDSETCLIPCSGMFDLGQQKHCTLDCTIKLDTSILSNANCVDERLSKLSLAAPAAAISKPIPKAAPLTPAAPDAVTVGNAAIVQGIVEVQDPDGTWKRAARNRPIKFGEHIRTNEKGRLKIILADNTEFTLGANSDIVIDEFVYDPKTGSGTLKTKLTIGLFRWVTGKVAQKAPIRINIRLPAGDLGTRGTDFIANYDPGARTLTVHTYEGIVTYTPDATGQTQEIPSGQSAVFQEDGTIQSMPLSPTAWDELVKDLTSIPAPTASQWAIGAAIWAVLLAILFSIIFGLIKVIKWTFKKR